MNKIFGGGDENSLSILRVLYLLKGDGLINNEIEQLRGELIRFTKRNYLDGNGLSGNSGIYCGRCLRAHLYKVARGTGVKGKMFYLLLMGLGGEIGHKGYYLDKTRLKKVVI